MPPIVLTDDARDYLMHYPWYGNIRELKNVTEQIAVVETERTISRSILENYLNHVPQEKMPALVSSTAASGNGVTDRELLLKALSMGQMISEMRNEINELRQAVTHLAQGIPVNTAPNYQIPTFNSQRSHQPDDNTLHVLQPHESLPQPEEEFQETEMVEDEPLALEEREKKAIRMALERHGGKRTLAAKELHISERTLYRKIKEYGIKI
jgi:DNA-binding NtrC family response regulator